MIRRALYVIALGAVATGLLSCLPTLDGEPVDLFGQELRLTLLHTSDIHSRLIPFDYAPLRTDVDLGIIPEAGPFGGATRMSALIKRERARADRALHLDSGDCFQGAPIFNQNNGEAEFRWLSMLRMDGAVVGNHEFDAGAQNFANMARDHASFPLLAANYVWEDHRTIDSHGSGRYTQPYTIRVVNGLRVGVIGMANISSLNSIVEGGNSLQATPLEQNEAARGYVELLRPMTDLIVLVSHLGLHEDQEVVRGYEAFFEYGRIKEYVQREYAPWKILEWNGDEGADESVVKVHIPGVSGIDVILGGHLHVVLNPPQTLADPSGRQVLIAHSGAFAKYVGRLEVIVKMPDEGGTPDGAEVVSHDFRVFPIDGLWCDDSAHALYKSKFWGPGEFLADPRIQQALATCRAQEDRQTTDLLQPYILGMDFNLSLSTVFAYAPRDVSRRNNATGGDSPLGNLGADSMRKRRRVEAEMALTNSLGIRDNIYAGPVTQESMFNVFPFENTINIMYLSGLEVQELFDFVTERSSGRGCQSQAQVSGARFTMDCAQAQLNEIRYACDYTKTGADNGSDCPQEGREGRPAWQCLQDGEAGRCWAHSGVDIQINGKALDPNGTYKIAVNDYIAKGGSGFNILKRNTTRIETGISLRDSLVGYMKDFCTCEDINAGRTTSATGEPCGNLIEGKRVVDDQTLAFCASAREFQTAVEACGENDPKTCELPAGPNTGRCTCRDALQGRTDICGFVTSQLKTFCENPTRSAVIVGVEDGRIGRRVK